ncbi:MAG: TRAP transporter small permease [Betaproteobacteria bacterium]
MRALIVRLTRAIAAAASFLFIVIVAISALEVGLRYGFDSPTIWVHELSIALAAAAFTLGGPIVHAGREHIAITYLLERLGTRSRRWISALNALLTLVFLGLLTWASSAQALRALDDMETSGTALNWPTPVALKCLLALCCGWMLLQTLAHLAHDLRNATSGSE